MRTAVFTDNDFQKVNGVTTTWRAVLQTTADTRDVRIYTASDDGVDLPDYFAAASFGCGLPWYGDMRVYLPRLRHFRREVQRDDVSVIHVATPGPVGLAGRWLARRLGLPLVGSYHTQLGDYAAAMSGSPRLGRGLDAYMRWFYGPCATLLVPSEATLTQLAGQGYPAHAMRVWPRGVDTTLFSPDKASAALRHGWRVDERRPAILYAGRLSVEKGLAIVEAVQRRLHRRAVAHRFIFAGDGPMRARLMRECPDGVFLGSLSHAAMAAAMASSDMLFFPSATDTFGNVVIEAQASGLAAVVSDQGGPAHQVRPGVTGSICTAGDADAFADAIVALLRDPARRLAMGQAARQAASSRSWHMAVRPLLAAWHDAREAAAARRGRAPYAPPTVRSAGA